jgi:hypothetical protein
LRVPICLLLYTTPTLTLVIWIADFLTFPHYTYEHNSAHNLPITCVLIIYIIASGVGHALAALKDAFPSDRLAVRGTEEFSKRNQSYLSLLQSDIQPAAISLPRSKEEVAEFVRVVKPFALEGDTRIAIRGAGQQPVPGCSNIENGITVDLCFLSGFELGDGVVSIGAGERWGPVYEALTEQRLGVTGSRSALGGIGGLTLSGKSNFIEPHRC